MADGILEELRVIFYGFLRSYFISFLLLKKLVEVGVHLSFNIFRNLVKEKFEMPHVFHY